MTTNAILPPTTAKPRCACGATAQVYADDHTTPLCAKCWLARHDAKTPETK